MFAKLGRTSANVEDHVEHLTLDHSTQLSLGVLELVMQPTQSAPHRHGVIVLDEWLGDAQLVVVSLIIALKEEAPVITPNRGFYQQHTWK